MKKASIPILMYHQIGVPSPRGSPSRSLTVEPAAFERHMLWLKRLGYQGLSMRDLLPYLRGEKSGKVIGITFDDGYRNVHENALPVLQALGFTATNYFVSRQVGGSNIWDTANGIPYSPCMSKAELREWDAFGHEVGSHTLDHPRLPALAPDEARRQIGDARRELEDMTGRAVEAFCYPHGGCNAAVRTMVEEAGYSSATTIARGRARAGGDILLLPRFTVRRGDGWMKVLAKSLIG
ncbi:MAG: polysaccharide deacetylase family protein [Allorhizobium sp.]